MTVSNLNSLLTDSIIFVFCLEASALVMFDIAGIQCASVCIYACETIGASPRHGICYW